MAEPLTTDDQSPSLSASGGEPSFCIGPCPNCERKVLTARVDKGDQWGDVCLHCGHAFKSDNLVWVPLRIVADLGYALDGSEEDECDSHGGCRDGACGVQQPPR